MKPSIDSLLAKAFFDYNARFCQRIYSELTKIDEQLLEIYQNDPSIDTFLDRLSKLSIESLDVKQARCLQLSFIGGLLQPDVITAGKLRCYSPSIVSSLLHSLSSTCVSFHSLAITVAEHWWLAATQFGLISEEGIHGQLRCLCLRVLALWDSDEPYVVRSFKKFLVAILRTPPGLIATWINQHVVCNNILCLPAASLGPLLLQKGMIHCYSSILQVQSLVWFLEHSQHVTTSLLLSLGHNYTASVAADALKEMLSMASTVESVNLERIQTLLVQPFVNYVLHEQLSCPRSQLTLGAPAESDIHAVKHNRRMNFAHYCLQKHFTAIKLPGRIVGEPSACCSTSLLACSLFEQLDRILTMDDGTDHQFDHRLFLWLHLLGLNLQDKGFPTPCVDQHSLILTALYCGDDQLSSVALSVMQKVLDRQLHAHQEQALHSLHRILRGVWLLMDSSCPQARNKLVCEWGHVISSVRHACASLRATDVNPEELTVDLIDVPLTTKEFLSDSGDPYPIRSKATPVAMECLIKLIRFVNFLWNGAFVSGSPQNDLERTPFWPGITYQRAKVTLGLLHTASDLLNFDRGDMVSAACLRVGYAQNSIRFLRTTIQTVASSVEWEYQSAGRLYAFLHALPLLTPPLHPPWLEFIRLNWPRGPDQLTEHQCRELVLVALRWCDSYRINVYSAGGNLLAFLVSSGYLSKGSLIAWLNSIITEKMRSLSGLNPDVDVLKSAKAGLGLGFLLFLDNILANTGAISTLSSIHSTEFVHMCITLCDQCLCIMGCQSWIKSNGCLARKGASSFKELGESILRVLSQAEAHRSSNSSNPSSDDLLSGEVSSIELAPAFQHVLSWSWNMLRLTATTLSGWASQHSQLNRPIDSGLSSCCSDIGNVLVHILLHCRHRGTVEAVCTSLQHYLSASSLHPSHSDALISCQEVLDTCWDVLCHCEYSVTRRTAGLWPAIKAALLVERAKCGRDVPRLLVDWLNRLMKLAQPGPPPPHHHQSRCSGDEITDSPRVLAIHLLRGIFADAQLRPHQCLVSVGSRNDFVVTLLRAVVIPAFDDPDWTVYNAALQLHGILIYRLMGSTAGRVPPATSEVFTKYDGLYEVCLAELESIANQPHRSTKSASRLVPILTLLSRMNGGWADESHDCTSMRQLLYRLLITHPNLAVRQLAALSYLTFIPVDATGLPEFTGIGSWCLLRGSVAESVPFTPNALHGQMCLIDAWLSQPVSTAVLQRRRDRFNWCDSVSCLQWLLGNDSRPCSNYLLGHLCTLMCRAFNPNRALCDTLRDLRRWFEENTERVFRLSGESFRIEALHGLHSLASRLFADTSLIHRTIQLEPHPVLLTRFLLARDQPHPILPHVLSYLVANPHLLHTENPHLCWRIIELWSANPISLDSVLLTQLLPMLSALLTCERCPDEENVSRLFLCASVCLHRCDCTIDTYHFWLSRMMTNLQPSYPEFARELSAEAVQRVLFSLAEKSMLDDLDPSNARHYLTRLFFALFDESSTVRNRISGAVSSLVGSTSRPSHVISALSLLAECSRRFFPSGGRVDWFFELLSQIDCQLNERIVAECLMQNRSVLYERDVENHFCEPLVLIDLVLSQINAAHERTLQERQRRCQRLINDSQEHLSRSAAEHNLLMEYIDPSIYDTSGAKFARYQLHRKLYTFPC